MAMATGGDSVEERIRALEEQLRELQERHERSPRGMIERLVPRETRAHLRAARREQLLAVRSLIDEAVKRTEEGAERPRRGTSVRID